MKEYEKQLKRKNTNFCVGQLNIEFQKLDGKHARKGNSVILKANEEFQLTKYANYISSEKIASIKWTSFHIRMSGELFCIEVPKHMSHID